MQDKSNNGGGFLCLVLSWRNWQERQASNQEVASSSLTEGNYFENSFLLFLSSNLTVCAAKPGSLWVLDSQLETEIHSFSESPPSDVSKYHRVGPTLKDLISELKRSLCIFKSRLSTALLDTCTVQCHPNFFCLLLFQCIRNQKVKRHSSKDCLDLDIF